MRDAIRVVHVVVVLGREYQQHVASHHIRQHQERLSSRLIEAPAHVQLRHLLLSATSQIEQLLAGSTERVGLQDGLDVAALG